MGCNKVNKKKIFIVGSGRLANSILSSKLSFQDCDVIKWENQHQALNESCLIIHGGSGRQLNECLEFCSKTKSVLIELATGLKTERITPDFPLIICPNTSILLLKTLRMIKLSGAKFENYTISITESHQSTKSTEPGTAFHFADALKVPHEKIISVRDPQIQQNKIGIPYDFLDRHAYHKIVIKDNNDEVTIETKVLGHDSYANGVGKIITACISNNLENKRYTVFDLIENEML
jgi:dihydrodipicolinate reductase